MDKPASPASGASDRSISLLSALHLNQRMLVGFAIGLVGAALLAGGRYFWLHRVNRRRSVCILGWIECAFSGRGYIGSVRWNGLSRFQVELCLCPTLFRRASLAVQLESYAAPSNWLRRRMETVTFEAELDTHPGFDLYLWKHHWRIRSSPIRPKSLEGWQLARLGPMAITTEDQDQKHRRQVLDTLLAARSGEFLHVTFRKRVPQFVACAPLHSLSPEEGNSEIFEMLQALASSASTSAQ